MKVYDYDGLSEKLKSYTQQSPVSSYTPPNGLGITFRPFSLGQITDFFTEVIGVDLTDYLPQSIIDILHDLEVTCEDVILQRATTKKGMTIVKLDSGYLLDFAFQYTGACTFGDDNIKISDFYIAFTITKRTVSATISTGNIQFLAMDLNLQAKINVPSLMFEAALSSTAPITSSKKPTHYLDALKKEGAASIELESIRFMAAFRLKNFQLHLSVKNVLNLHDKFTVKRFQADVNYLGQSNHYNILAWTNITIGFEDEPLDISLLAKYQSAGADKRWLFSGSVLHPITLSDAINNLTQLFGEGNNSVDNPFHLPDFISNTVINKLGLSFEGSSQQTSDYEFTLSMDIPVGERTLRLDVYAHFAKNGTAYQLELSGALFIEGYQLAIAFAKTGGGSLPSDSLFLGSLSTPIKLDSKDLVKAIAPKYVDDIPLSIDIFLENLLLGMHSGKEGDPLPSTSASSSKSTNGASLQKAKATREYLFRLMFKMDVSLKDVPLLGPLLPSELSFNDGQLVAANNAWKDSSIDNMNQLLSIITPTPPEPFSKQSKEIDKPTVDKGISLSGTFQISDSIKFPLFLNFGAQKTKSNPTQISAGTGASSKSTAGPEPPPVPSRPDQNSQQQVGKHLGPVHFKKVGLVFKDKRLGLKITGGLALAIFEFDLIGFQVSVPQSVLNNPSDIGQIEFDLDGFGVAIQKGPLSIVGGFLRKKYPAQKNTRGDIIVAAYNEYNGIVQLAFPPFALTGMGSYANYEGHTSLFLFVALGFPITLTPAVVIQGMSFGFGIHRDFISPAVDQILSFPLVQASVTPPPPIDIEQMVTSMHHYFPPKAHQFFVVAGVKFKAIGLIDNLIMLSVKFGREFAIDIIGISSVFYSGAFIELGWKAHFEPEKGDFFLGGQLTNRSFLLVPNARLTGGFAVQFWTKGEHEGDFVVSLGGYHPKFKRPAHYPDHIPRVGISFQFQDMLVIKGGVYFAICPHAIMMGASLDATLQLGALNGHLLLTMDAIIWYQPFHYDLMIAVDASINLDIPAVFTTIHIHAHLHLDVHVWGPEFAGKVFLDVGPKTFTVTFGDADDHKILPVDYERFKKKFIPKASSAKEYEEEHQASASSTKKALSTEEIKLLNTNTALSISVTKGLLRKVKDGQKEIFLVNAKELEIELKSVIPLSKDDFFNNSISPWNNDLDSIITDTTTSDEELKKNLELVFKQITERFKFDYSQLREELESKRKDIKTVANELKKIIAAIYSAGITPMDIKAGGYTTQIQGQTNTNNFRYTPITSNVPTAIWGDEGLKEHPDRIKLNALSAYRITTLHDIEGMETHEVDKSELAFNEDVFELSGAVADESFNIITGVMPSNIQSTIDNELLSLYTGLSINKSVQKPDYLYEPTLINV